MRKEYGQALRTLFAQGMKARFPFAVAVQVDSPYRFPNHRPWLWKRDPEFWAWILLEQDAKGQDQFNVLMGWSRLARYPQLSMVPCAERPDEAASREEYLCRLPSLWTDEDLWWKVRVPGRLADQVPRQGQGRIPAPVAREVMAPRVADALDRLQSHGIPWLESMPA